MEDGGDAAEAIFTVAAGSSVVDAQIEEYPEAGITHLVEIRTKLKFKGNKMELRNPQLVPALIEDINNVKAEHEGSQFVYCIHIGTSAGEKIKTARPGFMEGRVKALVGALEEEDPELAVGDNAFEHFESTRFAGLVMKVFTGEAAPECKKEDLVPPTSGSLVQVAGQEVVERP